MLSHTCLHQLPIVTVLLSAGEYQLCRSSCVSVKTLCDSAEDFQAFIPLVTSVFSEILNFSSYLKESSLSSVKYSHSGKLSVLLILDNHLK